MKTEHAGLGAAIAVLVVVSGLFVLAGIILWMMWMQPGIQHSPSERSSLHLVYAQWRQLPTTGSPEQRLPDRTTLAGQSGLGPMLTAELVNQQENARNHRAVVRVQTDGVSIVDPNSANNRPKLDEAHIEYRLDNGSPQQTTAKNQTYDNLSPGRHRIDVTLASNDNHPVGKPTTLFVQIP